MRSLLTIGIVLALSPIAARDTPGAKVRVDGPCCETPSQITTGVCKPLHFSGTLLRTGELGTPEYGWLRIMPDDHKTSGIHPSSAGCWAHPNSVTVPGEVRRPSGTDWRAGLAAKCSEGGSTYERILTGGVMILREKGHQASWEELGRAMDIAIPNRLGKTSCSETLAALILMMTRDIDPMTAEDAAIGMRQLFELALPDGGQ